MIFDRESRQFKIGADEVGRAHFVYLTTGNTGRAEQVEEVFKRPLKDPDGGDPLAEQVLVSSDPTDARLVVNGNMAFVGHERAEAERTGIPPRAIDAAMLTISSGVGALSLAQSSRIG